MLSYPENLIAGIKALPYLSSGPFLSSVDISIEDLEFGISNLTECYKEFLMHRFKDHLTYKAIGENMDVGVERSGHIVSKDLHIIRYYPKKKLTNEEVQ